MRLNGAILWCSLLFCISASYDMTYIIFHNKITGPARKTVRIFSNFDLSSQPAENQTSELTHASTFINQVVKRYGQDNFQSGADYFLECYKDTSLSIVAYIFYARQSYTLTDRYYGMRVRDGVGLGNFTLLGYDMCQACRAGRDMPFFKYDSVDVDQLNDTLLANILRDVNNDRKMSTGGFTKANITMIKSWKFPNGTLYIPCLRFLRNNTQIIATVLNTTGVNMRFINSQMIPYIVGNIAIDYVYVRTYIEMIRRRRQNYGLNYTIPIFEYYLDPTFKDLLAFAVTFCRQSSQPKFQYSRFMGYMQSFQSNINSHLQTPIIKYEANFTESTRPADFNIPYFINSSGNTRMRSKLNNSYEYQLLYRNAASISGGLTKQKLLDLFSIDFPNNNTLYMLVYSDNGQIHHQYQFMEKDTFKFMGCVYYRIVQQNNQSFNNGSDWRIRTNKLEQCTTQLLITNGISSQRARTKYFRFSQYCSIFNGRFELTVMHSSSMDTSDKVGLADYCYQRYFFTEDVTLNRIRYHGLFRPPKAACYRSSTNSRLYPTSICSNLKQARLNNQNITQIIKNLSQTPLTNSQGQIFLDSEVVDAFFINSSSIGAGAPNMYYISFIKNGISSYFVLNGAFDVIDYVQKMDPQDKKEVPLNEVPSQNTTYITKSPQNKIANSTNNSVQPNTNNRTNILYNSSNPNNSTYSNNSTANNSQQNPTKNETNSVSSSKIYGKGNLPLQFIQKIYLNLSAIILSNDPRQQQYNPIIYYYIGAYNELTVYGIIYSYFQIYVLYEVVHLSLNNTFIYIGKSFISDISLLKWEPRPVSSPGQILSLTVNEINKISSLNNVAAGNVSVMGLPFIDGGYFFVQVRFLNGFNIQLSFLRYNLQWWPIYNYLDKSKAISYPSASSERIQVQLMTRSQVGKDINIVKIMNILQDKINILTANFSFSKIERGRFVNGTLYYLLSYTKNDVSSTLIIQIIFDPLNSKILYGNYEQKIHPKPSPTQVASAIASSPNNQQLVLKEIIDFGLKLHSQLTKYKELYYQVKCKDDYYEWTLTYLTQNGCTFKQILKISPLDLRPEEISFVKSS